LNTLTKYKYVYKIRSQGKFIRFKGHITINGIPIYKDFRKIRDAARWVDMALIEHGREPVNILKRK